MKCYTELVALEPEPGYSAAALTARVEVLEIAMKDAIAMVEKDNDSSKAGQNGGDGKSSKDNSQEVPNIHVVEIAYFHLSGALALLEQVIKLSDHCFVPYCFVSSIFLFLSFVYWIPATPTGTNEFCPKYG